MSDTVKVWIKRVNGEIAVTRNIEGIQLCHGWCGPAMIPEHLWHATRRTLDICEGVLQSVEAKQP